MITINQINAYDGGIRAVKGPTATAGIFATYPHDNLTFTGAFIDQTMCTAFLCIIIGTITDPKNKIPRTAQPPLFGAMISLMTIGYGFNAGNAMNPARDLSPRLFTFCVGYGKEVFSHFNYAWPIIPVFCPLIGAVIGTWIYRIFLGANIDPLPPINDEEIIIPTNQSNLLIKDPTKVWPPSAPPPTNFIVDFSKSNVLP
uniref:Uncharacterized protein n=1 Tax=Panagrolaimus superbus TaxID=310955 RepID=A0A914YAA5_9BILA